MAGSVSSSRSTVGRPAFVAVAAWAAVATALFAVELAARGSPAAVVRGRSVWWDSLVQLDIARHGYSEATIWQFPGFPLAVRAAHAVVGDWQWAGVAVAAAAGLTAAVLFRRWCLIAGLDERGATVALLLLLAYPWAFFLFGVPYNDGLFLALALGAFSLLERRHPWSAAAVAALACATRPTGIVLVAALLVRGVELDGVSSVPQVRAGRLRVRHVAPALGLGGLAAFAGYCWVRFGDPFVYARIQTDLTDGPRWGSPSTWPPLQFLTRIGELRYLGVGAVSLVVAQAALTVLATACVPAVARRFGAGYAVFLSGVVALVWFGAWDFASAGRYLIAAFPAVALLGERLAARRAWTVGAVVVPMGALGATLLLAFTRGAWYGNW